jgi:uncharacterized protein YwqG
VTDFGVAQEMVMSPADAPVTEPVTKFGGQPVWVERPTWPLSRELGTPMRFVGQVVVPATAEGPQRLAYLFITQDDDEDVEDTWGPEAGENAVICQPGSVAPFLEIASVASGPTVGPDVAVTLVATDDAATSVNHVGGAPVWVQTEETPDGFTFLCQLDAAQLPFWINFGDAGVGYAFVDGASGAGRFLWQGA